MQTVWTQIKPDPNCQALSGSKLFDTDDIPERIFKKNDFEKTTDDKKHAKLPSRQRIKKYNTEVDLNLFLASGHFCHLLINFAISSCPDQV